MQKQPRKSLFSLRVPTVELKRSGATVRPDLLILVEAGHLHAAHLNRSADLTGLINLLSDMVYELKCRKAQSKRV